MIPTPVRNVPVLRFAIDKVSDHTESANAGTLTEEVGSSVDIQQVVQDTAREICATESIQSRIVEFDNISNHDCTGKKSHILEAVALSAFCSDDDLLGSYEVLVSEALFLQLISRLRTIVELCIACNLFLESIVRTTISTIIERTYGVSPWVLVVEIRQTSSKQVRRNAQDPCCWNTVKGLETE